MVHNVLAHLNATRVIVLLVGVYFAFVGSYALAGVSWQYYSLEGGFWAGISFLAGGVVLIVLTGLQCIKN
jgi:uncharacterized membrane protein